MAGKTELGKARKPKTPRKTSKAGSKKRAGKTELGKARKPRKFRTPKKRSADDTMKSIQDRWLSGRTLSDQDISSIAAAVGSMMANPSRRSTRLGEHEAKHRATGPGRKKGGRAKK